MASVRVLVALARVRRSGAVAHLLDPCERERTTALPDRDAAVTAHALLRLLLAGETGLAPAAHVLPRTCAVCGSDRHGRPGWGALQLSLARTPELVAAAVCAVPVGVDVELERRTAFDGFDGVVLGPGERADPAGRGCTWARKEAVLKADGRGLTVDPRTVLLDGTAVRSWDGGAVQLADLPCPPGSAAAVAVLGGAVPAVDLADGDLLLSAAAEAEPVR